MDPQTFVACEPYLFRQYSAKYGKEFKVEPGTIIPANERIGWFPLKGIDPMKVPHRHMDHWFEPTRSLAPSHRFPGRLFTTRMPQGITGRWQQRVGREFIRDNMDDEASLSRTLDDGLTNPELFRMKVDRYKVTHVIVLVEEKEMAYYGCSDLFDFYRACNLKWTHLPIQDESTPRVPAIKKQISEIVGRLGRGENLLMHCMGGSGRTGMMVVGALRSMGCERPIYQARKVKTVYLDTEDQAAEVQNLSFSMHKHLARYMPKLAMVLVAEHLHLLCANPTKIQASESGNELSVQENHGLYMTWQLIAQANGFDRGTDYSPRVFEFVQALQDLLKGAGYSPSESSSYITVPVLTSVLRKFGILECVQYESDDISFVVFMDLMQLVACEQVNLAGDARRSMGELMDKPRLRPMSAYGA